MTSQPTLGGDDTFQRRIVRRMEEWLLTATGNMREGMVALDAHGVQVLARIGEADEIRFTRPEIESMAGRVDLVTHNHDDDSAFTLDDLNFAVAIDAREIDAFGPTRRWRLLRPGELWPPVRAVTAAFNRVERQVRLEPLQQRRAGTFAGDPFSWPDRSGPSGNDSSRHTRSGL
jgi:hypothetical protein